MEVEDLIESAACTDDGVESGRDTAAPSAEAPGLTPMTRDEFEGRLVAQMNSLLDEASERRMLQVFADVTAWKLAVLAHHRGAGVTGEIVLRFGHHLANIEACAEATREAEAAKGKGHLPH